MQPLPHSRKGPAYINPELHKSHPGENQPIRASDKEATLADLDRCITAPVGQPGTAEASPAARSSSEPISKVDTGAKQCMDKMLGTVEGTFFAYQGRTQLPLSTKHATKPVKDLAPAPVHNKPGPSVLPESNASEPIINIC